MKPADDTENAADPAAVIRGDIERTRGQMASNVNAIEERLSPAHIKEQIASVTAGVTSNLEQKVAELKESVVDGYHETKDHLKQDLGREIRGARHMVSDEITHARAAVREATVGRVEHMVQDARESVSEAGTSIIDTIKRNPIPAGLIGVGIGWLIFGSRGARPARGAGVYSQGGGYGYSDRDEGSDLARGARRAAHDVGEAVNHFAHDASERIGSVAGDARHRGEELARGAGRQVMRAERGAESLLRENPLAVGAVALAIGAAIGLSLPHTQVEDEWMGDTKDRLFHQVEEVAGDAIHKAEEAVGQLTASDQPNGKSGGQQDSKNGGQARSETSSAG